MFGDLGKIMKIAGEMKRKMPELQERLAASEYSADAGGGAVAATVNGKMQLVDMKIASQLLEDGDVEMLCDLVKAAVVAAQQKASAEARQAMKELTGGMGMPGLDELMGG